MSWNIGNVQPTQIMNFPVSPGFNIQQEGRSPALTLMFETEKDANEARVLMQQIFDKAAAIFHA